MSATTDTAQALEAVAEWIDASAADDATAFVHSTAIRDAAHLIQRQAICIADLRREVDSRQQAAVGVAQKIMQYRADLRSMRNELHAANRPALREGLRIKLRDQIDEMLAGEA